MRPGATMPAMHMRYTVTDESPRALPLSAAKVTLVVVPRERFGVARTSLESVYRNTRLPFELIYVDGNSPARVARDLAAEARERGFRLLRTEHYLSPNEARNLGAREVSTEYTLFLDNDVLVAPGWLDALLRCAEETGAWVVNPTHTWGPLGAAGPDWETVHLAGGEAGIEERDGVRRFREEQRFGSRKLGDIRGQLERAPCELAEFHCMLVATAALRRIGPLDEALLSTREHVDFSLLIRQAGGAIYHEPQALVCYVTPPPVAWSDVPYYVLRWSDAWNLATLEHVNRKWGLNDDYVQFNAAWLRPHRRLALAGLRRLAVRALGTRRGDACVDALERAIARQAMRGRPPHPSPAGDKHAEYARPDAL